MQARERCVLAAIPLLDKIDLKTKAMMKIKEGHYITIKGSIQEEDITFVNICVPQIRAPKYRKQISTYREKWRII